LMKALEERPSLRLDIAGMADPVRDRQALSLRKLKAEVQARWRRARGKPAATEETIPADEEQRLIKDLHDEHQKKMAPATPAPKADVPVNPPTFEEMTQILVAVTPVDEEGLRSLARQRADQIREHLTGEGKLADERVFLLDVDLTASDHEQVRSRLSITAAP
jgi:hypothetical protein